MGRGFGLGRVAGSRRQSQAGAARGAGQGDLVHGLAARFGLGLHHARSSRRQGLERGSLLSPRRFVLLLLLHSGTFDRL